MFQFRRFPSYTYLIQYMMCDLHRTDFSIRKSADQCLLTAPRSLSQLTTSFFGSQCQGIHPALMFALPFAFDWFSLSDLYAKILNQLLVVFTRLKFLCPFQSSLFDVVYSVCVSQTENVVSSFLHYTCYSVFKVPTITKKRFAFLS